MGKNCRDNLKQVFFSRQSSIVHRQFPAAILTLLLLTPNACTRRATQKDLELNWCFAEILKREDRRDLGEDGFFPKNLLGNPHAEVRQWCAFALGRIGSSQALPWLYEAFHAEYASVRAASAFALGEIEDRELIRARGILPDPRAAAELAGMLEDPSLAVRMRAIEALGKIGGAAEAAEIIQRVDRFPYDGSPAGRAYLGLSITALARLKNTAAIPLLEKLSGSQDPEIRGRAQDALQRLRSGLAGQGLQLSPVLRVPDQAGEAGLRISAMTEAIASALSADRKNSTTAILQTTQGDIEIELFREQAPATAAGFVFQAREGSFNGLEFALEAPYLLTARMDQRAAAGRLARSEVNLQPFVRGSVGMVLSDGDSRTDSFFIALAPQPYLDGVHTCFGRIISGIQVAERLASGGRIKQVRIKDTISYLNYRQY